MEHGESCDVCGLRPVVMRLRGATEMVAESPAMQTMLKRTARFAASSAPVAVFGETGTGKEIVARVLHANSPRAERPFVPVNVAALPAELLESELFGHARGAFTGASGARRGLFEAADQGTLFLDEMGEMPLPLQAKLLRALEDGEIRRVGESQPFSVDVRVICATHRDLGLRVSEGTFREDLFYRLKVLTLEVPPLRARTEDIIPLSLQFLAREQTVAKGFTAAARTLLEAHRWPGNVRELENAIKHGAALATGPLLDAADLPHDHGPKPRTSSEGKLETLAELERRHILRVLDACDGSQSEAARILGVARNTLWRKLRQYA